MMAKSWWKSKTLWVNLGALVAGVGTYVDGQGTGGLLAAGLALANVVLRSITVAPLGK